MRTKATAGAARVAGAPPPTKSAIIQDGRECAVAPPSDGHELRSDITLVTQASVDRLWMLPQICSRWGGAMIVATLQPSDGGHVAWPAMAANDTSGCALQRLELARSKAPSAPGDAAAYPINWLRNVGISCVATSHFFIVDVDFWPTAELLPLLRGRLTAWTADAPPTALVVPNFQRSGHGCRNAVDAGACRVELAAGNITMPNTLAELHACLRAKNCGIFDGEYNPQGQASTDVRAWKLLTPGETRRVPCITSDRYEPFIALRKAEETPPFDERFSGYGKNKVQYAVHLRHAGYRFEVLGGGFVVHFPHMRSDAKHHWLHSSAHAKVDQLFSKFGREMSRRYADTSPRTPMCTGRHAAAANNGSSSGGSSGGGSSGGGASGGGASGGGSGRSTSSAPGEHDQPHVNSTAKRRGRGRRRVANVS